MSENPDMSQRLFLVACEVFCRELSLRIAATEHQVDTVWLPKGLHDQGGRVMATALQQAIDQAKPGYDAVLLAYGLCNNGIIGLAARHAPLVVYRSHDCIACLLGDRATYEREFAKTPGTYWQSGGWIERGGDATVFTPKAGEPTEDDPTWQRLVKKYGEDNARFLWDELKNQANHYERLAFIDTGVGPQAEFKAKAGRRAADKGWRLETFHGDLRWIHGLIEGPWDAERFLVVPPGERIVAKYDGTLVGAAAASGG